MNVREIITVIMQKQNKTNSQMAAALGITQAACWERVHSPKSNNLTVKKLNEMLRVLDHELVIAPRAKGRRIVGSYVITDGERE